MCSLASQPTPQDVVAAVIRRGNQVLICQRPPRGALASLWEFPGGKVDPGEQPEQALRRELMEELGVQSKVGPMIFETTHAYASDRIAHLMFFETTIEGEIQMLDHQDMRWVKAVGLRLFEFVGGDEAFVDKLARGEL
jgi:8-oxo-dGTP diphosphatase